MRITFVIIAYPPAQFGGMMNHTVHQAEELVRRGHEVKVITTNADTPRRNLPEKFQQIETINGVKVFRMKRNAVPYSWYITQDPWELGFMEAWIQDSDVVHMQSFRTYQNLQAREFCKKHGVPYVLSAGGSVPIRGRFKWFKILFDPFWGKKLIKDAGKLIALTDVEAEHYVRAGASLADIEVIPNAADIDKIPKKKPNFLKRYGISKDERVILYVGRLHRDKGVQYLIKAMIELSMDCDNHYTLLIAGSDHGHRKNLEALARMENVSMNVKFLGHVTGNDKWQLYLNADVLVVPSKYEAFGNVIAEAMACKCPVVVSDSCDLSRLIWDKQLGIVWPRNIPFEIIIDIREAIGYSKHCGHVERAYEYVTKNWTWKKVVDKLEKVYKGCPTPSVKIYIA